MMLNTNRFLVALIVGFAISPLVQAQLKTFKPGDVIKSSEINENFEYLEEQIGSAGDAASAQCSATQDGNSAVISCADGSSAVLAGAGSVLILPNGVSSEVPDASTLPIGEIYWQDGSGTPLGKYASKPYDLGDGWEYAIVAISDGNGYRTPRMFFYQNNENAVLRAGGGGDKRLLYAKADCEGTPLVQDNTNFTFKLDGQWWIQSDQLKTGNTLVYSHKSADDYDYLTHTYASPGFFMRDEGRFVGCENLEEVEVIYAGNLYFLQYCEPPQEWFDAVYPLTLKQYPN